MFTQKSATAAQPFLPLLGSGLAELFAKEGNQDSNSLQALRIYFARDFGGYVDVGFNVVSNKNSLSFGIDIGFKKSVQLALVLTTLSMVLIWGHSGQFLYRCCFDGNRRNSLPQHDS
jgi:hypothetical protein